MYKCYYRRVRRSYNYGHQQNDPTVWYIAEDGTLTQNESEAKNKIRRNRKFNYDSTNNRYVEVR